MRAQSGPGRGGNNKIEGGEGNECCVFLSLEKHVSTWGVLHTHTTCKTGITRLRTNVGRRGEHAEGGINRIGRWGGSISSGYGKKVKNHGLVRVW